MKRLGFIVFIFVLGFVCRDLSGLISSEAKAAVGGTGYYDLKSDWDFKRAVKSIVENCSVDGDYISC